MRMTPDFYPEFTDDHWPDTATWDAPEAEWQRRAGGDLPNAREASIAKCYANEITREVTATALQLMGGYGYSREYGMERRLRDSFGWGIAGGAIDIQKVNIAAELVGRRFDQRR